jgi:hypothetical protein
MYCCLNCGDMGAYDLKRLSYLLTNIGDRSLRGPVGLGTNLAMSMRYDSGTCHSLLPIIILSGRLRGPNYQCHPRKASEKEESRESAFG